MKKEYCPNCGSPADSGIEFCPNCGYQISKNHLDNQKQIRSKSKAKHKLMWIILCLICLLLASGGVYAYLNNHNSPKQNSNSEKTSSVSKTKKSKKSNYDINKSSHKNKLSSSKTSGVMPKEYQGEWYNGKDLHFVIKPNEIDLPNSEYQKKITKDSSPLKLPTKNADGSYTINDLQYMTGSGGDLAYYWLAPMTINGKKETVLVGVHRQGQISIDTQHPTDKSYYFIAINNGHFIDVPVGTQDIDKYYKMKNEDNSDSSNNSKSTDKNDLNSNKDNDNSNISTKKDEDKSDSKSNNDNDKPDYISAYDNYHYTGNDSDNSSDNNQDSNNISDSNHDSNDN